MLQALGKGQSCNRGRTGPGKELEHRDGELRSRGQGVGLGKVLGQEPGGCGGRSQKIQVGGRHLKHPGDHRELGKLCPSPGGWQEGLGGGIGLYPYCPCPEEEEAGLRAASRHGWAGEAGSFPALLGTGTLSSLPGTGAAQRHRLFIKATPERSKEVTA